MSVLPVQFERKLKVELNSMLPQNKYSFNEKETLSNFKKFAVDFKSIMSLANYPENLYGREAMKLRDNFYKLIDETLAIYDDTTIIEPKEFKITDMNSWSHPFWGFLHTLSILSSKHDDLLKNFAVLLVNLNLLLPCGICSKHYNELNPLNVVAVPMIYTKDPITVVYNLHNIVNSSIGKRLFDIKDFCSLYNLKIESIAILPVNLALEF